MLQESFYSAATAPRKVAAKAAGSGCSSDSGERIQASPSKHAGGDLRICELGRQTVCLDQTVYSAQLAEAVEFVACEG